MAVDFNSHVGDIAVPQSGLSQNTILEHSTSYGSHGIKNDKDPIINPISSPNINKAFYAKNKTKVTKHPEVRKTRQKYF